MGSEVTTKDQWSAEDAGFHIAICFYNTLVWGATPEAAEETAEKIVNGQTAIKHPDFALRSIDYALSEGKTLVESMQVDIPLEDRRQYLQWVREKLLALK